MVLCPRPHLSQCYVATYFGVGSRHETAEQNGISHVLEHMLFRGTAQLPDATVLNARGRRFRRFPRWRHLSRPHGVRHRLPPLGARSGRSRILAELVQTPRYQGMEIERAVLREELLETLDSRGRVVDLDNIVHRLAFGSHGLGLPIEGTLPIHDGIKNGPRSAPPPISRRRQQRLERGRADGCARVLKIAERQSRSLPRGERAADTGTARATRGAAGALRARLTSQVDMRISFRAVPMHDPSYPGAGDAGRLLADGLASRMHAELVDRRGLAYTLNAGPHDLQRREPVRLRGRRGASSRGADRQDTLGVSPVPAVIRALRRERAGATRRRYRYGVEFMGDSAADLASWYGRAVLFGVEKPMADSASRSAADEREVRRAALAGRFRLRG